MKYLNSLFMLVFGAFLSAIYSDNLKWTLVFGVCVFIVCVGMNYVED